MIDQLSEQNMEEDTILLDDSGSNASDEDDLLEVKIHKTVDSKEESTSTNKQNYSTITTQTASQTKRDSELALSRLDVSNNQEACETDPFCQGQTRGRHQESPSSWIHLRSITPLLLGIAGVLLALYLIPPPPGFPEGETWNSSREKSWRMLLWFLLTIGICVAEPFPLATICLVSLSGAVFLGFLPKTDEMRAVDCTQWSSGWSGEVINEEEAEKGGGSYRAGLGPGSCAVWASSEPWSPLSGFADSPLWLVLSAFVLSASMTNSGLGRRIGYLVVSQFGGSNLRLGYCVAACEVVFAAMIPSNTARGAGVILPILLPLLKETLHSCPEEGTERKAGNYLILLLVVMNNKLSVLFPTASANAALLYEFAKNMGEEISFVDWTLGLLPHMICQVILCPLLLYWVYPPQDTIRPGVNIVPSQCQDKYGKCHPAASVPSGGSPQFSHKQSTDCSVSMYSTGDDVCQASKQQLDAMGPLTRDEKAVLTVLSSTIVLWIVHGQITALQHLDTTIIALMALGLLLMLGVLDLKRDVAGNDAAWGMFVWFGILLMMSGRLTHLGVFKYLAEMMGPMLQVGSPQISLLVSSSVYGLTTYLFASTGARIVAMSRVFIMVLCDAHIPLPAATRAVIIMTGTGYLAPYSNTVNVPLLAPGYVQEKRQLFQCGLLMFMLDVLILVTVDVFWWRLLGIF